MTEVYTPPVTVNGVLDEIEMLWHYREEHYRDLVPKTRFTRGAGENRDQQGAPPEIAFSIVGGPIGGAPPHLTGCFGTRRVAVEVECWGETLAQSEFLYVQLLAIAAQMSSGLVEMATEDWGVGTAQYGEQGYIVRARILVKPALAHLPDFAATANRLALKGTITK